MALECDVCKAERQARCRVVLTSEDPRYTESLREHARAGAVCTAATPEHLTSHRFRTPAFHPLPVLLVFCAPRRSPFTSAPYMHSRNFDKAAAFVWPIPKLTHRFVIALMGEIWGLASLALG